MNEPERAAGGSLARLVAMRAAERPSFPAVHVGLDEPWTIGAVAAAAQSLAARLDRVGVRDGDRVALQIGNDERFLVAVTATWLLGAAAIAIHPAAPAAELTRVIDSMQATAIVAASDVAAQPDVAVPTLHLERIPRSATSALLEVPEIDDDRDSLVLLTSGSTGAPKGVVLSHRNGWSNLRSTVSAFRRDTSIGPIPEEDRPPNLIANPLSHTAGVVRLLFALYVGRSVVLLPKFDARAAKAALDRYGIDHLTINPAMLRMLLEQLPADADLGAVRYVSSGTAPLPASLREAFEDRFGVPVLQAYGQTEAFGGVAIESVRDVLAGRRRPGSVGRALPGVEIRIVDQEGVDRSPGDTGEIVVRTSAASSGYVGDTSASDHVVDQDGWLRTGDLGHLDGDGYLYITGRLKNIIICGGFNVAPEEVEAVLAADEAVREAVVVALPDDRLGEVPVAVVEADDDASAILDRCGTRLAPYKRPRHVFVVEALPRVATGKVDRRAATTLANSLHPSSSQAKPR